MSTCLPVYLPPCFPFFVRHMSRSLLRHWPLALLAAVWLLFFWRYLIPGAARVMFPDGDFTQQFFIFRDIAYRALAAGHLPLWADCFFAGYPFHADPQSQLFYPPIWISFAILKLLGWGNFPLFALTLETTFHYLLASVFTYLFLRVELTDPHTPIPPHPLAPILGALVFTYGGYLTGYPPLQTGILETAAWLPLILLSLRRLADDGRASRIGWSALALAVAFFAGHPQTFLFVAYFSIAYFIHRGAVAGRSWRWTLLRLGAVFGLLFGLSLIQLLPQAQYLTLSTRASLSFEELSRGFPVGIAMQFFLRDPVWSPLYVGLLPFALALFAVAHSLFTLRDIIGSRKRSDRWRVSRPPNNATEVATTGPVFFWLAIAVVALLLSLGGSTPVYTFAYWLLPGYRLFRGQERIAILVSFALATLAAFGVMVLLNAIARRADARLWQTAAVLIVGLTVADLYAARTATNLVPPFDPYPYLSLLDPIRADPDPFFRVQDDARMQGHFACGYGFKEWGGISPIRPLAWSQFDQRAPESLRWKMIGMKYLITWKNGAITREGELPPAQHVAEGPAPQGEAKVYRMFEIPRRAWLVNEYRVESDRATVFDALSAPGFDPFSSAVLLGSNAGLSVQSPSGSSESASGEVTVGEDWPGHIVLNIHAVAPALLVVSEAYYPGWVAQVNGQSTRVVEADAFLLAVPVPAGESVVELNYRPMALIIGGIASIVALLFAVGLIVAGKRRQGQNV